MSHFTMKTLSSIRSLTDEWSFRKEGGKQSFFVLKEIDKLLADTPVDDVVSSKDVADKKNEVTMLRLERDEQLIRQQLDRAKKETQDVAKYKTTIDALEAELRDEMQQKYVAIRLGAEKAATVLSLNETISDLRMAASDMLDTINECARGEAEDSRVLMQVVEIVKKDDLCLKIINQLADILVDYLDAPEPSVVTLKTPSIGTWVGSKNEETLTIDESKMEAVRMLVGSDMWVLHTDEEAVEDKQQKDTIDELKDFIRDQCGRVDDRDNRIEQLMVLNEALRVDIAGQDRFIEGLKTELAARNTVIKDFKAIEQKETDRLHAVIEGNGKIIDELNDMCSDVCDKLERIDEITKKARTFGDVINRVSANHIAIDEITKIIQEE